MAITAQDITSELAGLAQARNLRYPIDSKSEFVEQMCTTGEPVTFLGSPYDARFAANLIPTFFFPVAAEAELIHKVLELCIARGLLPVDALSSADEVSNDSNRGAR